jgi:hypothetical protein
VGPSLSAVQQAADLFADPAVRTQLRQWHLEGMPLMEMVDRLGFTDLFDDTLRAAVVNLSPDEVAIIREAYLAEIDRLADAPQATMPIACEIAEVSPSVIVTREVDTTGRNVARIHPRPSSSS